ncbi:hypothetical protein AVEN_1217-1 [Araneus ventricosus]|uniref:Uncharacterized protein n=1 Tax=Araneus ventricosus TaxID=182803 RepID=A0A4Y1ZXN7_ARAVE|nr:hypothetical protein AVEN_1217-1 [Araneus ventricosus]
MPAQLTPSDSAASPYLSANNAYARSTLSTHPETTCRDRCCRELMAYGSSQALIFSLYVCVHAGFTILRTVMHRFYSAIDGWPIDSVLSYRYTFYIVHLIPIDSQGSVFGQERAL